MTLRRARQREPGRHLAYCLPLPPPDSKLFGDYESTFLQPNSPTDYPSNRPASLLCYRRGAYYDRWIKCTIAPVSVPSVGRGGGLLSAALIEFGVARFRMTNARNHSRKCCIKGDINYSIYSSRICPWIKHCHSPPPLYSILPPLRFIFLVSSNLVAGLFFFFFSFGSFVSIIVIKECVRKIDIFSYNIFGYLAIFKF